MSKAAIPGYIYREESTTEQSLVQGDILKVEGQFKKHFLDFYPKLDIPIEEERHVMVLTQSCDLVRAGKRKPKLNHINVCPVRNIQYFIRKLIDEEKPLAIGDKNLLQRDILDRLKDKLSKLLNNSDQKIHFFLPQQSPFKEDMVALLPLSFSFRLDHYDLLLESRILGLKPEFQAKVGYIIGQLYGRIGTPDLFDCGWDDKKIRAYINHLLDDLNLVQVPNKNFIEYIKANFNDGDSNIEELIDECEAAEVQKSFEPLQNEMLKKIRNELITLVEDKEKLHELSQLEKPDLSKEITRVLSLAVKSK